MLFEYLGEYIHHFQTFKNMHVYIYLYTYIHICLVVSVKIHQHLSISIADFFVLPVEPIHPKQKTINFLAFFIYKYYKCSIFLHFPAIFPGWLQPWSWSFSTSPRPCVTAPARCRCEQSPRGCWARPWSSASCCRRRFREMGCWVYLLVILWMEEILHQLVGFPIIIPL